MSPNFVTAIRAALVLILAALLAVSAGERRVAWAAVTVATAVSILDGVDGWIARRTGQATAFGARFDMETDALFILVLSLLTWQWGKAGAWVLLIGVMRYLFVAAGWMLKWLNGPLPPTVRGKTIAVWQMVTLIVSIGPVIPVWLSTAGCAVALSLLAWSFAIDVGRLWVARAS